MKYTFIIAIITIKATIARASMKMIAPIMRQPFVIGIKTLRGSHDDSLGSFTIEYPLDGGCQILASDVLVTLLTRQICMEYGSPSGDVSSGAFFIGMYF